MANGVAAYHWVTVYILQCGRNNYESPEAKQILKDMQYLKSNLRGKKKKTCLRLGASITFNL